LWGICIVGVILDLVKDETKVVEVQFCARSQKDIDCINRGVIIGAQHASTSSH
jgi:hypothetical protein